MWREGREGKEPEGRRKAQIPMRRRTATVLATAMAMTAPLERPWGSKASAVELKEEAHCR
jgi:hypothetical protein